jgi:4-hydroxythreonine-4-phosphate dehydrogenase (EC 1.1.1.262)
LLFAAFNPHAGDGGIIGKEEEMIIKPVIKMAQKKFKNIFGPYPSDTLFSQAIKGKFDCVVAMYHDQAMIPVKTICFDSVVNLTLGLPFIRTSPAHGTAFDIAGKNIADAGSMVEAIKLAVKLS